MVLQAKVQKSRCLTTGMAQLVLPPTVVAHGRQEMEKIAKKHEKGHCKYCRKKDESFCLHNTIEFTCYNADLTPVWQKDSWNRKIAFAQ